MRDVVICLPGITGSVLRKDGRDVWNISGGAVIGALTTLGKNIQGLKLEEDPPDVDDLGDGITAPEVIRDVHLIPGLWKIDGYTKMLRYIEETFDVTRGRNLFEFPYDWRRDNRVAARKLQRESRRVARSVAHVERRGGCEARARRPLDGRIDLSLLPRVSGRLARHADPGHLRDSLSRLAQRARHAREREEDQVLRSDRARTIVHGDSPIAPDVPVLYRWRQRPGLRRRGGHPASRPHEGEGRARLPSRHQAPPSTRISRTRRTSRAATG